MQGGGQPATARVFVSYRTADAAGAAAAIGLAERLKRDLGPDAAYHAPTDNRLTGDWADEITRRLATANLVIAVIGPGWERGGGDTSLLDDPDDWVRREIAHALATDTTDLLPVFVDRAGLDPRTLPDELARVATTHGLANFDLVWDYQSVLMQAWASWHAQADDVLLVVADASASGIVAVDQLVRRLERRGEVDVERLRELSQAITAPPGTAVVPLRAAAETVPGVVLLEPETLGDHWRRRTGSMEAWIARHPGETLRYGSAGAGLLASLSVGGSWGSARRWAVRTWRGLHTAGKAVVATAAVATVGVGAAAVVPTGTAEASSFAHGDHVWTVGQPTVLADDAIEGSTPGEGTSWVAVDATVSNPSDDTLGRPGADVLRLARDDDRVDLDWLVDAATGEGLARVDVAPGDTETLRWIFEVPEPVDADEWAVVLGAPEDHVVTVDTGGTAGVIADVDTTVDPERVTGTYLDAPFAVAFSEAWFGLDAGVAEDGTPLPDPGTDRRADDGQVYLHLTVAMEVGIPFEGTFGRHGQAQVLADGQPGSCAADRGYWIAPDALDYPVTCEIPVAAQEVVLRLVHDRCVGCTDGAWTTEVDTAPLAAFRD